MLSPGTGKALSLANEAVQKRQLRLSSAHWNVLTGTLGAVIYEQAILDMLRVEDEARRIETARRLQRAARGPEPLICLPQSLHNTKELGRT
jgi:hypothetical protein